MRATWKDAVLAESDETVIVEGNHYFPPDSINLAYLDENSSHTICPWKGVASYYNIVVNGESNTGGAWTYPDPKPAASQIKDYVAFWRGVKVSES